MHRVVDITPVSAALGAAGGVEVLAAAPRLRLRASPCQTAPMIRRYKHAIHDTEH
ncbi:MAG: hypothetical protein ACLFRT_05075 [Actinomycetota bacterium]